jgi:2-iminobutanoate/2-iminopropanoate deaminase
MSKPVGPYTPIVKAGPWLVSSGQIGIDADAKLVDGGLEAQWRQALANLQALFEGEGYSLQHITKTTIFVTDMKQFGEVNRIYLDTFGDHRPARSTVEVSGLPLGALIEIEAWAYVG